MSSVHEKEMANDVKAVDERREGGGHKRRHSSMDGKDPRKKYMAEQQQQQQQQQQQPPYDPQDHLHLSPQAYYEKYYSRYPYEEAYQHHQQVNHYHQQNWPSAPHHATYHATPGAPQQDFHHVASQPQTIRPQFSRYHQPQQHLPSNVQPPPPSSSTVTVHVPENIASALVSAQLKNKLPKGLTYRKVCSRCGRQRAEHGEFGFGNKCLFTTCGRCGAKQDLHKKGTATTNDVNGVMGVLCTLTEEEGAKAGASEKYDAMLADLAARAEIRAVTANVENSVSASVHRAKHRG